MITKQTQELMLKALEPFADYASLGGFVYLPDDTQMTVGSPIAAKQITAKDFKNALLAWAVATAENKE